MPSMFTVASWLPVPLVTGPRATTVNIAPTVRRYLFCGCFFCYLWFVFVMLSCLFLAALLSPAGKGLGSFVGDVFLCFVTFPYGVLSQIWYLILSISDRCPLLYLSFTNCSIRWAFITPVSLLAVPTLIIIERDRMLIGVSLGLLLRCNFHFIVTTLILLFERLY